MIGLCEVRCSETNISSLIAAKPSRSTSMVNRSTVLTGAPPARCSPLLQDQVAGLVLPRGLAGQDQRGGSRLLDHARPGDPVLVRAGRLGSQIGEFGSDQDRDLLLRSVRVEVDQPGSGGRLRAWEALVGPADLRCRFDRADPERYDLERGVETERVAVQTAPIERGADVI